MKANASENYYRNGDMSSLINFFLEYYNVKLLTGSKDSDEIEVEQIYRKDNKLCTYCRS